MATHNESFNSTNLKNILQIKSISINELGKHMASVIKKPDDYGIRQIRRYLKAGAMPYPWLSAICDYLKIDFQWLSPAYSGTITEEMVKEYEKWFPVWHQKLVDTDPINPLDKGIMNLFTSQGYVLRKQTDGAILFQGKYMDILEMENISEEQYQHIIQPVLNAVNQSAAAFEKDLKEEKEHGKEKN